MEDREVPARRVRVEQVRVPGQRADAQLPAPASTVVERDVGEFGQAGLAMP